MAMLDEARLLSLAPHVLTIGVVVFAGLLLSALVGELLGGIPVLGAVLAETFRLTGIVTAVLYALRVA